MLRRQSVVGYARISAEAAKAAPASLAASQSGDTGKKLPDEVEMCLLPAVSRPLARSRLNGRAPMKETKINLYFELQWKQTAGAAFTSTYAITPSLASEYSDVASLYDEIIVDGGSIQFLGRTDADTAYTADTGPQACVVAYDPLDNGALGSVLNGMQHSQHLLFAPPTSGPLGFQCIPIAHSKRGLMTFRWSTPSGPARRTGVATAFGHEWSDTIDSSVAYGYLKPYLSVQGTLGFMVFEVYATLNCRVRCRS